MIVNQLTSCQQVVPARPREVWKGRLEEHIQKFCRVEDPDPGCKPCTEVFHPPKFNQQRSAEIKHPRHHKCKWWRCTCFPRAYHRPGSCEFFSSCRFLHQPSPSAKYTCHGNIWSTYGSSSSRSYGFCSWYSCYASSWSCSLCYASCLSNSSNNASIAIGFNSVHVSQSKRLEEEDEVSEWKNYLVSGGKFFMLISRG